MAWPVVLLLLTLSTPARAWDAPDKFDVTLHAFSEAWIVADCLQTLDIKNHSTYGESNFILGYHPSDSKVVAYCGSVVAVTTLVWALLPERVPRWILDGGILYFEVPIVINNRTQWGLHFTLPF